MPVVELLEHLQRFPNSQVILQRRVLKLDACFFAEASACRFAEVVDFAGCGRRDTLDDLHRCGFARTVGTQQTETDTFGNFETDVVHGDDTGITLDDIPGLESGLHREASGQSE